MKKLCFWALLSLVVAAGCSKDEADDESDLNLDITENFDPLFARELQKRGYVADAKHIALAEVKDITELDVSGVWDSDLQNWVCGELTSLQGIGYFESLKKLQCYWNKLTFLDVSRNTMLEYLSCDFNRLTSLDVSENPVLETLFCDHNQLTSLDVSKNPMLEFLGCNSNGLTSLDVTENIVLESLLCYANRLTSLDARNNPTLKHLECQSNRLVALDMGKSPMLETLDCSDNQLSSLNVSRNRALKTLFCCDNPGDGAVFPVTAWFDNNSIPSYFTKGSWEYDGKTVRIDYRKAE
ncbi:MAG: hypothetical protein K2K43_02685 [Alistipes sp.]|nr:hypothetical protein [Alistipes sp.]